jgi:hypothetical protein
MGVVHAPIFAGHSVVNLWNIGQALLPPPGLGMNPLVTSFL